MKKLKYSGCLQIKYTYRKNKEGNQRTAENLTEKSWKKKKKPVNEKVIIFKLFTYWVRQTRQSCLQLHGKALSHLLFTSQLASTLGFIFLSRGKQPLKPRTLMMFMEKWGGEKKGGCKSEPLKWHMCVSVWVSLDILKI